MIVVLKTEDGFVPISGNPTLTSLDGETRAPLAVLLCDSWTDKDRARFGVFIVEPMAIPEGKQAAGSPSYERGLDGKLVQVIPLEDKPIPRQRRDFAAEIDSLAERVAKLEKNR